MNNLNQSNQFSEQLENESKNDPLNKRFMRWSLYPLVLIGFLASVVSGVIEYKFITGIFQNFLFWGFITILTIEGGKIACIALYEIYRKKLRPGLVAIIWFARLFFVIFSCVASFAKISQFMDSPRFEVQWAEKKKEINNKFDQVIQREDLLMTETMKNAEDSMRAQMNIVKNKIWNGSRYKAEAALYEKEKVYRESRLAHLRYQNDSTLKAEESALKNDPKVKNEILIGVFSIIHNAGWVSESSFTMVYSWLVIIIAFLLTILLEFTIWIVFSIYAATYGEVFHDKINSYVHGSKIKEEAKRNGVEMDVKDHSTIHFIKNLFKKRISKAEAINEAINETNNL